jgi:formylmethanofuran:tetrahydromethanopterin formyltransferase
MIIAVFSMMDSATIEAQTGEQQARQNMNFWIPKKVEAEAALAAHKETLDSIKKAAGKGTWRERAGQAVGSPALQAAEKLTTRLEEAVTKAEENYQIWKRFADGWQKEREGKEEVDQWVLKGGKTPDCILEMEEAFNNELIPGCVAIPIPKIYKSNK